MRVIDYNILTIKSKKGFYAVETFFREHPLIVVLPAGLEPATSSFVARRSIHLSYESIVGRKVGFEPTASQVTVGRSSLELLTPYILWKLVDSNHINRIFSPTHTPCLPSFLFSGSRRIRTFGTVPVRHISRVLF